MSCQTISSISSSPSQWKYEVFLSFRGEDTRNNFTSHLCHALEERGILVFKDNKDLDRGKLISPELLQAIEQSRFLIVIFSKNYASSSWCLDELVKINECMDKVRTKIIPIFYHVDPSDVRNQTGLFKEAFIKHEETFKKNIKKVKTWRRALTNVANIAGWDATGDESELIREIVKEISSHELGLSIYMNNNSLVGIGSHMETLRKLIGTGFDDVRMIGICGMGGIGKTTIVRVVYDHLISHEFDGRYFLANVREKLEKECMNSLRKELFHGILRETYDNFRDEISMLKRVKEKKTFVVIDDVPTLVVERDWFGKGSRIIITTRDEHILRQHKVDEVYRVEKLNDSEALELFCLKAFNCRQGPPKDYVHLSQQIVQYADGLPLALEVLGSFLLNRSVDRWQSTFERLRRHPEPKILDVLKISFDGLNETEKKIFLDIACFFKGYGRHYVEKILDACEFSPIIGIDVLIEKSLITILEGYKLWMHDLLQEMGKQIVKEESSEPEKRSRLWETIDIHYVLKENKGTEKVEGIMLNFSTEDVYCSANAFLNMTNLRLLKISNVQLLENRLDYLSNKLRLLDWEGYPLKSLSSSLQLDKLVELKLDGSRIEQPWKEINRLSMLTYINFEKSLYLKGTPDVTYAPNLKEVNLEGCERLSMVHQSLLLHKKITSLNISCCKSLTNLPAIIHMEALEFLQLCFCSKLKNFPEIVGSMKQLSTISLSGTAIKGLPLSIQSLTDLKWLQLSNCKNLVSLPMTINGCTSLEGLTLSNCFKLETLPESLGQVESLTILEADGTATRQLMSYIFLIKNLQVLHCRGCIAPSGPPSSLDSIISLGIPLTLPSLSGRYSSLTRLILSDRNLVDEAIPSDFFCCFPSLNVLDLRKNNFVSLPGSIEYLSKLRYLYLADCKRLQSLPELPPNINIVDVNCCASLETLSNASGLCNSKLSKISCINNLKLIGCCNMAFSMLKERLNKPVPKLRAIDDFDKIDFQDKGIFSIVVPGKEIPKWFNHQSGSSSIKIERPPNFRGSKLLGFVVGCVFGFHEDPAVQWGGYYVGTHSVSCTVNNDNYLGDKPGIYFDEALGRAVLDHFWLLYFPRRKIDGYVNRLGPNHIQFSFRGRPTLEVKACGVHLVYEEDVEEFNKINNQSTFWNVKEFDQDLGGSTKGFEPTEILSKGVQGLFWF